MLDTQLKDARFARKCDLDLDRLSGVEDDLARQIASALNRPLTLPETSRLPRYSKDPMAYAEFMRAYRLSSAGDSASLDEAAQRLSTAVARDPGFSLAHATLSFVCATRHFRVRSGKRVAGEGGVSLLLARWKWILIFPKHMSPGPSCYGDLRRTSSIWKPSPNCAGRIGLQKNLPHAYNRLGTILAHIGLLDRAREMYERGRPFQPGKTVSHSIVQVFIWNRQYDLASEEIEAWRADSPGNKYRAVFRAAARDDDW